MTKLLDTTHDFSSESGVELRMESTAVVALPSGETLGALSTSSQIQQVTSGILVLPSGATRHAKLTGTQWAVYPPNPVLQFSQSGFSEADIPYDYPEPNEGILAWYITHDSSGTNMDRAVDQAGSTPTYITSEGTFGAADFTIAGGPDYLAKSTASSIVLGNSNVGSMGCAFRFRHNPSGFGVSFALGRLVTNAGAHNFGMHIAGNGQVIFKAHDGTNDVVCSGTTEIQADTNYYAVGVVKSDGSLKIFLNGVDDTLGVTSTFSGNIRQSFKMGIGATDHGGNSPMSGLILDIGWWYRDVEATDELVAYHAYLANRFTSFNGDE